jgi:hypothetical protein
MRNGIIERGALRSGEPCRRDRSLSRDAPVRPGALIRRARARRRRPTAVPDRGVRPRDDVVRDPLVVLRRDRRNGPGAEVARVAPGVRRVVPRTDERGARVHRLDALDVGALSAGADDRPRPATKDSAGVEREPTSAPTPPTTRAYTAVEFIADELVEITPSASAQAPAARARAQTRLPRRRLRKSPPAGGGQVTGWWEQALT